ncbi:MAG TPA: Hpt domain-containing protein [Longimicrobiales bacterium]|jgi:HPt (histidine-containing phosphotransfer) domain-containing protein
MDQPDVIDSAALDRLRQWGGVDLLRQMIRLFLENAEERLRQIRDGFDGQGLELVERGSHSLKSSAANVGASVVNRLAADMEDRAAEGDDAGARALHEPLIQAHRTAIERLGDIAKGLEE